MKNQSLRPGSWPSASSLHEVHGAAPTGTRRACLATLAALGGGALLPGLSSGAEISNTNSSTSSVSRASAAVASGTKT